MRFHRIALSAFPLLAAAGITIGAEPRKLDYDLARPVHVVHVNQQIANTVAGQLRASGLLQGYMVEIAFAEGTAELAGTVRTAAERAEAVRLAHSVPGVENVLNLIRVNDSVMQVQLPASEELPMGDEVAPQPFRTGETYSQPDNWGATDPQPVYRAPVPQYQAHMQAPPMPPHAWPTYAPYNNFSRVAHPKSYPYQQFPHMGPVYPFPKVPLGWRSVKLEFDDGHWWLSSHGTKKDWWFLRYW